MIVVNLLSGGGTGKSTLASRIFYELKKEKVNVELVNEFAKELTWEKRKCIKNGIYVFANQQHKIWRLNGLVDVVVVEGSILNTIAYHDYPELSNLIITEFNKYNNINLFINRVFDYDKNGRNESNQQAIEKDNQILKILIDNNIDFIRYDPNDDINEIIYMIKKENEKFI